MNTPKTTQDPSDHLDNDKDTLKAIITANLDYSYGTDEDYCELCLDEIVEYTQSKLKAFAEEFEKAIGEIESGYDTENPWEADQRAGRNKFRVQLNKALKAIKEKYQL